MSDCAKEGLFVFDDMVRLPDALPTVTTRKRQRVASRADSINRLLRVTPVTT